MNFYLIYLGSGDNDSFPEVFEHEGKCRGRVGEGVGSFTKLEYTYLHQGATSIRRWFISQGQGIFCIMLYIYCNVMYLYIFCINGAEALQKMLLAMFHLH